MTGWTIIRLQRSLGQYAAAWDALNLQLCGGHPLLGSLAVEAMLRDAGDGSEHLCLYREQDQVQAMCVLKPGAALAWTSFLPPQARLAPTLVADPSLLATLVRRLPGLATRIDLLANDPAIGKVLHGAPRASLQNHARALEIGLSGSFAAYWAARPRPLQRRLRQCELQLLARGIAWRCSAATGDEAIGAALARHAALDRGASAPQPEQQELVRQMARAGHALVFELWLDDQLAASCLAVRSQDLLVILDARHAGHAGAYLPGALLLRGLVEHAFASAPGAALVFYGDAEPGALAWATAERWIQHLTVYRGHLARALGMAAGAGQRAPAAGGALALSVFPHPDALPVDVQRYLARAERRNVGFGLAWYRNLVAAVYAGDAGVRFYVLRQGARIVGVMPLRAVRKGGGWHLGALANFYTTLYEPVLAPGLEPAAMAAMLAALERDFPALASLTLAPMDPASHAYQTLIGAMRLQGWAPFEYFAFGNWYLPVASDWTQYLAERSGTLRNTIKRMGKKLAGDGGVLEIVTDPAQIPLAITAYERVYAASWKKPEPFPDFMPGLLKVCAEKGMLRLGLAWLGGEPIAAQLWIVAHGRAEIYKVAYDERFKAYSPGTLVTALLMQHVIENDKVLEVDYLIGEDAYKKTWMSQRRERCGLVVYNPRSAAGIAGLLREAAGRALKPLRARLLARFKRDGAKAPSRA
jgi:hypothetical protein